MTKVKAALKRFKDAETDSKLNIDQADPSTKPGRQMAKNRAELSIKTLRQEYHNEVASHFAVAFLELPYSTKFWAVNEMDFFEEIVQYDPGFNGTSFSAQNLNNLLLGLKEKGAELGLDSFDRPNLEVFLRGKFERSKYAENLKKSFNFATWKAFVPTYIRRKILDKALEAGYDASLDTICVVGGNLSRAEQEVIASVFSGKIVKLPELQLVDTTATAKPVESKIVAEETPKKAKGRKPQVQGEQQ